eukprot:CAMPEP_0178911040 /NCGR_PEP_ID=MMETSP0786-20121207/9448_1 /TAXON_ID=186022 /ORGANISM="Thalassionema frauenfeldii, Strain CCMP 1798" /LENGTH=213 /DNA_ID=CAMNT_0020583391 /DNA_START=193 /DNA_END=834 /DNA_ORIENTATION=-
MTLHRPTASFIGTRFPSQIELSSDLMHFPSLLNDGIPVFDQSCTFQLSVSQSFEPQVDGSALSAFSLILCVFSLLQFRINQVNDAAIIRKGALKNLREIKSKELANEGVSSVEVEDAVMVYKKSIENEEKLRVLIPGVRIVAPNGPASASEEEVAAAKQYLGMDLREGINETNEENLMSNGAVAILALVGLSQIVLLSILAFDPMRQSDKLYP